MPAPQPPFSNRLLAALSADDQARVAPKLASVTLDKGQVLYEAGDDVTQLFFPSKGVAAALILNMRDGASAEAALIGAEGAIGGVISAGDKPAFARAVVQFAGPALKLHTDDLEAAKERSPSLREHFACYADCLLAQVMQSVACNALHDSDARLARWLLETRARLGADEMALTQDFIAEMLGVQRTYVTRVLGALQDAGAIALSRGKIVIRDQRALEGRACECYFYLRRHFTRMLPGLFDA
jgi:CRP-like cAMP-binding protein